MRRSPKRPIAVIHIHGGHTQATIKSLYLDAGVIAGVLERKDTHLLPAMNAMGIIVSGSGYFFQNFVLPPEIFEANVPILGFGSGMAALAQHLGLEVEPSKPINVVEEDAWFDHQDPLFSGLYHSQRVYMLANTDFRVVTLDCETHMIATSKIAGIIGISNPKKRIWGVSFPIGSEFTPSNKKILRNFVNICLRSQEHTKQT